MTLYTTVMERKRNFSICPKGFGRADPSMGRILTKTNVRRYQIILFSTWKHLRDWEYWEVLYKSW